jgi:hypothetical protein
MANTQFDIVCHRYSILCDNALRLNNIGVKYLVHGNEKLAIESLSEAMHIFKHLIGVSQVTKETGCARMQCSIDTHTNYMDHETVLLSHHWAQQQPYLNQVGSALFDCAITIVPGEGPLNVKDREDYLITSTAVVIFNLALAYHVMGICTTSGNQAQPRQVDSPVSTASSQPSRSCYYYYMTKAANIYEMAVRMLLGRSSRTAMLIQLASIRNILEIQLLMTTGDHGTDLCGGAKNKAPNGQELFSMLLLTCQQPQHKDAQLQDLVSNILLLLKPATIAAAA